MSAALVVDHATATFRRGTVDADPLGPLDVLIDIAFCGLCQTDVHLARDEWGGSTYPMVPGHEIAGHVRAVGVAVETFVVGDRVGVSTYVDSCRRCPQCLAGLEQYCAEGEVLTYNGHHYDGRPTYGGYRTGITVDEHFVVPIPAGIELQHAGPLMCAGTTVYSALRHFGAGPDVAVAIIGLGGLGHLAVQLARAMGATVTTISRSRDKAADSLRFGAATHLAADEALADPSPQFDLVVNTVGDLPRAVELLALVRQDGTWVDVGVSTSPRPVTFGSLADGRRRLTASKIGSPDDMRAMLALADESGVRPDITLIGADDVDSAFDTIAAGTAPYRYVLDISTIGQDHQ